MLYCCIGPLALAPTRQRTQKNLFLTLENVLLIPKWAPEPPCISRSTSLFLMAGNTYYMMVVFLFARLSNPFSTRRQSHWAYNALKEGDSSDIFGQPGHSTPSFHLSHGSISTSSSWPFLSSAVLHSSSSTTVVLLELNEVSYCSSLSQYLQLLHGLFDEECEA